MARRERDLGLGQSGAEAYTREKFKARPLGNQDRSPQEPRSATRSQASKPGSWVARQAEEREKPRALLPLCLNSGVCPHRPAREVGEPSSLVPVPGWGGGWENRRGQLLVTYRRKVMVANQFQTAPQPSTCSQSSVMAPCSYVLQTQWTVIHEQIFLFRSLPI